METTGHKYTKYFAVIFLNVDIVSGFSEGLWVFFQILYKCIPFRIFYII